MKFNKLSINYLKTTYYKKSCSNKLRVKIGEHIVPEKSSAKYLKITFDHKLKLSLLIDDVIKKLANATRILSKIRHYVR